MSKSAKIYVAGHKGLVGSAIMKELQKRGYSNIITRSHKELDLTDTSTTARFFQEEKPDYVFLAAAKVGGILANNTYRADFLYENLMIQNNVIHHSYKSSVKKLLFLGSTCIYPKMAPQPLSENSLLTGTLEYTNEPYAIAKIAGIKLCESYNLQYGTDFLSVMPTNLYGYNDNFNLETSHVLPALIRKIHLAKLLQDGHTDKVCRNLQVTAFAKAQPILNTYGVTAESVAIWGSGSPRREFLWSQDMADACVHILEQTTFDDVKGADTEIRNTHINIGTGEDISIKELGILIKEIVGFKGKLVFDTSKPDGTPKKLTDVKKLHQQGWKHSVALKEGIRMLYNWYLEQQ
ncbi:GDP-L-fucose synthase family protein [Dokdonia sp. Hel_I_53]|uniref:GDP-L-fucose synthase family protein n=1 Tax=Dokdonia sp. Hel_I_53 TaxID=1566287 RepID=UPI00119F8E32|nr:GDP-L-fucose synthase [Dokdonia sp. Hel_I_53]